jgi:hypothetical protein
MFNLCLLKKQNLEVKFKLLFNFVNVILSCYNNYQLAHSSSATRFLIKCL